MYSKKLSGLLIAILAMTSLTACDVDQIEIKNKDGEKTVVDVTTTKKDEETPKVETETAVSDVDYQFPEKLDTNDVLGKYLDVIKASIPDAYSDVDVDTVIDLMNFYDVGEIKIAPYTGQRLLVMSLECEGPCFTAQIVRFVWDEAEEELTLLAKHSMNDYTPYFLESFYDVADKSFSLESLVVPNTVMLPDGSNSMQLKSRDTDVKVNQNSSGDNPYGLRFASLDKIAFTDSVVGNVYLAGTHIGCLFVLGPDSVVSTYAYNPGLTDETNVQLVKWDDGSDSTYLGSAYTVKTGGCGIGAACYFIDDVPESQLEKVGQTNLGIDIYVAKNTARAEGKSEMGDLILSNKPQWELNNAYDTYVQMNENGYLADDSDRKAIISYEKFLADYPVLYWKDPFGRFSGISNTEYKPPAECGKPVIYLYPEEEITVSVQVDIDEFTVTEPEYGENGWTVVAKPNGELLNLADGLQYEYLFWEGISSKKLEMNAGFVIAKTELESFLENSLDELGLNEKESADFMEFWLPKMTATDHPYVLVSFVGTREFDKIAPLTIEPKPDTVIRVFMYYQPLWYEIDMQPQVLNAPERNGFTVIEWGGTSSDGWQIR
jgi:hypothetical protein